MANPYSDHTKDFPENLPPAEARRYEEAIVEQMREASKLPQAAGIESIELEGERPNTVLTLKRRLAGELRVSKILIWQHVEVYERDGQRRIESAAWSGGSMWSGFLAGEFEGRSGS